MPLFSERTMIGEGTIDFLLRSRCLTNSSMPPPTQFAGTYYGDYSGMAAPGNVIPVWSDTRNPALFLCPGTGTTGNPPQLCTGSATNAAVANDEQLRGAITGVPGD